MSLRGQVLVPYHVRASILCPLPPSAVFSLGQCIPDLIETCDRRIGILTKAAYIVIRRAAGCVRSIYDPGAYKTRSGAVPDRNRGSGYTAPTYNCRDPAGSTLRRLVRLCILRLDKTF